LDLPNNSCKPITNTAWVSAQLCKLQKGSTRLAAASDKVYQLLAHGRWFSPGTFLSSCNSIKTFDFSTLYTTLAKGKIKGVGSTVLHKKNGVGRYKYLVLGRDRSYFVKKHSDSTKMFSETDIINMPELLINNIFVIFGGHVFQQTVGISMGTNCAHLLTDLFLYSYEADFIQCFSRKTKRS